MAALAKWSRNARYGMLPDNSRPAMMDLTERSLGRRPATLVKRSHTGYPGEGPLRTAENEDARPREERK